MSNYLSVLKAMFKNKLRFSEGKSKRSVIGFLCLIGASYALVMAFGCRRIRENVQQSPNTNRNPYNERVVLLFYSVDRGGHCAVFRDNKSYYDAVSV